MIRKGKKYKPDEILPYVVFENRKLKYDMDGDNIKMTSPRLQNFKRNGLVCVNCGTIGSYFVKEKYENDKAYHLNLYAVNKDGNEILMTKDHIIPISAGGRANIENLQTMCCKCNEIKSNKLL